jgi:hypothetical protein
VHRVAAMGAAGVVGHDRIGPAGRLCRVAAIGDLDQGRGQAIPDQAGLGDDEGMVIGGQRLAARRQRDPVAVDAKATSLALAERLAAIVSRRAAADGAPILEPIPRLCP